MPNALVQEYRSKFPDTWKSDDEIMDDYASAYDEATLSQFPDFLKEYQESKNRRAVESSSVLGEVGQGFQRGMLGLKSTAAGVGALAADVVGADRIKQSLLGTYQKTSEEVAQEAAPSVARIEDIRGPRSALQYVGGKVGELVPALGEAATFAVAGSAVAPGPGTEAGAVGGFFARAAARSALKKIVDRTLTAEIRRELEDYAAGKLAGKALSTAATKAITESSRLMAGTGASIGNFAAMGAGGTYGAIAGQEGVKDQDALEAAAIGAFGGSIGALIPARILKGILPGLGEAAAASYVDLWAKKVPAEIMSAAGGMGAMEFFNLVAEKHAHGDKSGEFTKDDYSRMLNAVATGVVASAPAVGIQAIRGVAKPEVKTAPIEEVTPEPAPEPATPSPAPAVTAREVVTQYPAVISKEQDLVLHQIAERQAVDQASRADLNYLDQLPETVKAQYLTILETEVANAIKKRDEHSRVQQQREGDGRLVEVDRQDREHAAEVKEEGDQNRPGGSLPKEEVKPLAEAIAELPPEKKVAVEEAIQKPVEEVRQPEPIKPQEEDELRSELAEALGDEEVTPKPAAETEVVRPAAGDLPETSWIETVPESITAWRVPRAGKAKESLFSDLDKDPANNAKTKALGVFEAPDGSIVVASLYSNRGRKVAIPGKTKDYDALVRAGYKPLGYIKTAERQEGFFRQYDAAQWQQIESRLVEKVEGAGKPIEPIGKAEAAQGGLVQARTVKEPIRKLTAEDAQRIADVVESEYGMPRESTARANVFEAVALDAGLVNRIREVGGENQAKLANRIADAYEAVAARAEAEKWGPKEFKEAITKELTGMDSGEPPIRMAVPSDVASKIPPEQLAAVAQQVSQRLEKIGVPVAQVQTGVAPLYGTLAQSLGSFDRARQTIVWGLSDLTRPTATDIRVLFEEAGHALFDRESSELRDPVMRALARMAERSPEESAAVMRDIETAYPEGVPAAARTEEIAMGHMARKLVQEGFNPVQAKGIAQSVFRLFKEVYLKAAMWLQKTFLGEQYGNPETAAKYFQNRLESFLAGDQETLSFIDRLGGPKASRQEQLSRSEPVFGGARDLIEVYNPVTGQIDTNPVLLDSVEAALLNVRNDTRFSIPGNVTIPEIDPSTRLNRTVAVNNEIVDVRQRAAEAAGIESERLRLLNGLKDRTKIGQVIQTEAEVRGASGYNPNQRIAELRHEANSKTAYRDASKVLNDEAAKISKHLAADKETLPKVEARRTEEAKELERQTDAYKDADFMSDLIKKGFRNLLADDIRREIRVSRTLGTVAQQYQELVGRSGQPIDRDTVTALRRLYTGDLLSGENLFNMLDQLANDPSIDFSRPAPEIRAYIKTAAEADPTLHRYNLLSQDTRDSRAMLATVIAYGKLHKREMALLEARRMKSGEDRVKLEKELRDLWKETREQVDRGIRQVARSGAIQEVAKVEYRKALKRVSSLNRSAELLKTRIEVNEKALPEYSKAIETLVGKISQTEDTTFGDKWKVRVPSGNGRDATWEPRTINLNSSAGPVTSSQEQLAIVNRLAEWTAARETEAKNGDPTALGSQYQDSRRQLLEIVNNRFMDHALRNTDHFTTELIIGSDIKKLESFGTPTATLIGQKMRAWLSDAQVWRTQADREFGYKNSRLEQQALGVINRGRKEAVDPTWFTKYVRDSAMGFLERILPQEGVAREQDVVAAYQKLGQWLLAQPRIRPLIQDRMPEFMGAMREMIDSLYESGQFWADKNKQTGQLVEDPKLGGKLREAIPVGLFTFQRKFSDVFSNMVHSLRNSGWAVSRDELKAVAELIDSGKAKEADALIAKYANHPVYGDTVRSDFLFPLFHVPDESIFDTPALEASGTKTSADPLVVARAYDQAKGNLRRTFELIHDYYSGNESIGKYVQDSLMALVDQFEGANSALKKLEPRQASEVRTFTDLIPNAMIDARQYGHWPSEWFTYHRFDRNDNARMAERVSGQIHFGRDTRVLSNLHQTLKDETDAYAAKLKAILGQAKEATQSGKAKAIEAAAEKILAKDKSPSLDHFKTGKEKLEYLRKVSERAPFVNSVLSGMSEYFNRKNQAEGSLRWGVRFAQALSELMVNNPGSAISQLATMFDIPVQWGASPAMVKTTGRVLALTAKDIAGSLVQGIGFKFLPLGKYEQIFRDTLNDPEAARRFGDIFSTLEGESGNPGAKLWRQFRDIHSFTLNRQKESANYTPLRPLAPFYQFVMTANRALTVATWELADRYVTKGAKYLESHPGTEKLTGEMLGLKGLDRDSFDRWNRSIEQYGLRFDDMAKAAQERFSRGENTPLTNKDLARLYSVALNEVSLESNIATMPLAAFNNSILRFITPLLGWSFRRTAQLAGKRLDTQDQNSLRATSKALLGLAATGLGGLGISLVVDAYQEDLVGKKRNIRDLRVPTNLNDLIAIEERIARSGTLGLFGDLANTAVNVGTGQGDNRMLSVDQRVVALQSFQGLLSAVSNLVNQGFDPDYSHVVRPVFAALGGNGLLQYMQIANHAFDFDNVESRVVKRINASNYLRVVGRDQGMNLKKSSGGYATPTPTTPWIARMEYAAYANSPAEFREAYKGAVAEAKRVGKADPEDYVKKAFETRHPIRFVFAQVPSESEYRRMINSMDDTGRESVREAVRLFNYYGSFLGLNPFEGSTKKDKAPSAADLLRSRERAMARAVGIR